MKTRLSYTNLAKWVPILPINHTMQLGLEAQRAYISGAFYI